MKKAFIIPILFIFLSTFCVFSEDTENQTDPGFGLQSVIFSNVRNVNTDFTKNFSSMADYTLTPGDIFTLSITSGIRSDGSISNAQEFVIQLQKDYSLNVPFIGIVNVQGKTLPELQNIIDRGIKRIIPAQYINFVLTSPAQFNVFLYGGVNLPGYIVATPMMTVIDAIAQAKGFKKNGSYRQVQLIRKTEESKRTVITLDISKFYKDADLSANPSLQPGDKIYIPPADVITTITGSIQFPGAYELLQEETLRSLLNFAGNITPDARGTSIEITRINSQGQRNILTVALDKTSSFVIQNGDVVRIRNSAENSEMITVEGAVFGKALSGLEPVSSPTKQVRIELPYYPGISLMSALDAVGGPTPYAIYPASYIERRATGDREPINLEKVWDNRDYTGDMELQPGDKIFIPITKLNVFVTGNVDDPGAFAFQSGSIVWDYILLAGGITENIGDPEGIYRIDASGKKAKVSADTEVQPGEHYYIAKKWLFQSDQFVQNMLITTTWVVSVWGVVTLGFEIYDFFKARLSEN